MLVILITGRPRTATVEGRVTYQGRPVVYGSVVIISADKTARSGVILPDGSYKVEQVHPGPVRIEIHSPDPAKGRGIPAADEEKRPPGTQRGETRPGWFPLPSRFGVAATSGLDTTVTAGRNQHDIEMR